MSGLVSDMAAPGDNEDDNEGGADAREQAILRERRLIMAWSVAGFVVGWWGIVWAQPYGLCMAMQVLFCVTALGFTVFRNRQWTLIADGHRLPAGRIAFWPAVALGLRALWDTGFLDWQASVLWGLAGAAIVVAVVAWRERRISGTSVVFPAVVCFGAIWGALVFVNVNFDSREAEVAPVTVLGKSYTGERLARYDLFLSRWHGRPDAAPVAVRRSLHERLAGGDTVCVTVHPGALGWQWYEVDMCQ